MYRVTMVATRLKLAPIAICLAFGLAACGDDGDGYSNDTTNDDGGGYDYSASSNATSTTVAESADTTTGPVALAPADVTLTDSSFGSILSDGDGNTLYMYAPDGPAAATCTGGCAGAWPPYLFDGAPSVGEGLNGDLFTTVPGEGGLQLAYNGHPLYFFGGDSAAGDTNGQGSGGVWFILDADGEAITG